MAYSGLTFSQWVRWATTCNKFIDKYGNYSNSVQTVEPFGGQCVSLVQAWIDEQNIAVKARGNAADWYNGFSDLPLVSEADAHAGDLVVYPDYASGYGHIGILTDDYRYISQNPFKPTIKQLDFGTRRHYLHVKRVNS